MDENSKPNPAPDIKAKKVVIVVIVLVVILVIGFVLLHNHNKKPTKQTTTTQLNSAVVNVTKKGFVPATLIIKPNTTVEWKNSDTRPHQVGSNPYPSHSDLPGLDSKPILPGNSYTFDFKNKGNFKYYDGDMLTSHGVVQVQ